MIDYKEIGERIRKRRKELGLSQDMLASRINATSLDVDAMEAGQYYMSTNTLINLCNALVITPNELLGWNSYVGWPMRRT